MQDWEPISFEELLDKLQKDELNLTAELLDFWREIKVPLVKWQENSEGDQGGGFWIVGIKNHYVIWYNDIEEGFNIDSFTNYGVINEYTCEQDELYWAVRKLYEIIARENADKVNF